MIGSSVTLNPRDCRAAESLAARRHSNNRKAQVRDARIGPQTTRFVDVQGVGGELAFCRLFGIDPRDVYDVGTRSSCGGTDQGDCVLEGVTVDVKTTDYRTGKLAVAKWKTPKVQCFALMIGKLPTFRFAGFMRASDLIREDRLGTLGHGDTYLAYQYELVEFCELQIIPIIKSIAHLVDVSTVS